MKFLPPAASVLYESVLRHFVYYIIQLPVKVLKVYYEQAAGTVIS